MYNYGIPFQENILAFLWRHPTFFFSYRDCVKPQYFEREEHIDIARIIFNYKDQFKNPPSLNVMKEEVKKLCEGSKIKIERKNEYDEILLTLAKMDIGDYEYLKEEIVKFGQKQALIEAVFKSADDLKAGTNFDAIKERINKATLVGHGVDHLGVDYFDTINERMEAYDNDGEERIKTGNPLFDKVLLGGLARKELGIVIAPPGTGKTISLVNIGVGAVLAGYNVLHLSLEMDEDSMTKRYDSCFMNRDREYIKENRDKVTSALQRVSDMVEGKLFIRAYPPRKFGMNDMTSLVSMLEITKGVKIDVIIIDYIDLMKVSRQYGEKRQELEMLYEEVRGFGAEHNCAMWSATQANRGSLSKKTVTMADIAESFGKAAVADFMVAISQTKEEKREQRVRYHVAKFRRGKSDETIHCYIHYDKIKVLPDNERGIVFQVEEDDDEEEYSRKPKRRRSDDTSKGEERIMGNVSDMMKGGS